MRTNSCVDSHRGNVCGRPTLWQTLSIASFIFFYLKPFILLEYSWLPVNQWSCSVVSDSLQPHGLEPTRLLHPWNFPGKSNGVGCHFLLQGIFPTQGSNPGLLHYRQMLYHLSHWWYFQVKSKGAQPYTHMYPFSPKPLSHPGCHITLNRVHSVVQ